MEIQKLYEDIMQEERITQQLKLMVILIKSKKDVSKFMLNNVNTSWCVIDDYIKVMPNSWDENISIIEYLWGYKKWIQ